MNALGSPFCTDFPLSQGKNCFFEVLAAQLSFHHFNLSSSGSIFNSLLSIPFKNVIKVLKELYREIGPVISDFSVKDSDITSF